MAGVTFRKQHIYHTGHITTFCCMYPAGPLNTDIKLVPGAKRLGSAGVNESGNLPQHA